MSYFIKEKVLRIPLEEKDKKNILEKYQDLIFEILKKLILIFLSME